LLIKRIMVNIILVNDIRSMTILVAPIVAYVTVIPGDNISSISEGIRSVEVWRIIRICIVHQSTSVIIYEIVVIYSVTCSQSAYPFSDELIGQINADTIVQNIVIINKAIVTLPKCNAVLTVCYIIFIM